MLRGNDRPPALVAGELRILLCVVLTELRRARDDGKGHNSGGAGHPGRNASTRRSHLTRASTTSNSSSRATRRAGSACSRSTASSRKRAPWARRCASARTKVLGCGTRRDKAGRMRDTPRCLLWCCEAPRPDGVQDCCPAVFPPSAIVEGGVDGFDPLETRVYRAFVDHLREAL